MALFRIEFHELGHGKHIDAVASAVENGFIAPAIEVDVTGLLDANNAPVVPQSCYAKIFVTGGNGYYNLKGDDPFDKFGGAKIDDGDHIVVCVRKDDKIGMLAE